jgi:DNA ligase-1
MPTNPIGLSRRLLCGAALAAFFARPAAANATNPAAKPAANPTAPALLLAREWPADADPAGYLVSEKLDGVRALWDGHTLRFRSGAAIAAPSGFLARLPAEPLDGELWLGRGRFDELSGVVRRLQPDDALWRDLTYQVFELPAAGGTFAQRAAALQALCRQQGFAALRWLAQQPVADRADLQRRLDAVVAAGGEGLVLHRADAPTATGRGPWLWKHKPLHDAEARVLAHLPGQGRLAGQVGALQVRTDKGLVFNIGSGLRDADRAHPPAVGQRISYRHRGFTPAGVPRFASYWRPAAAL